jgi:hypothetical protein
MTSRENRKAPKLERMMLNPNFRFPRTSRQTTDEEWQKKMWGNDVHIDMRQLAKFAKIK